MLAALLAIVLLQTPPQSAAWGDHAWRNGVGPMSEHYFRNGAGFLSAYELENGTGPGSFYHLIFATGRGSVHYWLNSTAPGSAHYWQNGAGPGSDHYWRNGRGCPSEFGWRNGATCTSAEAFDFMILCIARAIHADSCAAINARLDDWLEQVSGPTFTLGEPLSADIARMRGRIE